MDKQKIKEKFASSFKPKPDGFSDPVIFEDDTIGFSTQKELSNKLQKKLNIAEDREYVSLIHVAVQDKKFDDEFKFVPITVRLGLTLKDDGKFFVDDSHIKNKKYKPIELISRNDYTYQYEENCFYESDQKIDLNTILNNLYSKHIQTSKPTGFLLRAKLNFWKKLLPKTMLTGSKLCAFLYHLINGGKLIYRLTERSIVVEPAEEEGSKFEFYGYSAHKKTIFLYSLIHLIAFSIIFFVSSISLPYFKTILTNDFLTIIYVIVSLTTLDKGVPKMLEHCFETLSRKHFNFLFREISV